MIIDILIFIAGSILFLLAKIFGFFGFVFPEAIAESVEYFISHLGYLTGFFDIDSFMQALGTVTVFSGLLYTFKVIKYAYGHLPWFGRHHELPRHRQNDHTSDIGTLV